MPSRLTVVLLSLLLAVPTVIFWLWFLIQPTREATLCPEQCRCDEVGIDVNCSDAGLKRIPSILPIQVRILVLDGNSITIFENDTFVSKGMVDVEKLQAGFCKIRKIELGAFNGLTILTDLSLEGNDISEIIPGTFEMISRLEYLDLKYNKIEHLECDVFRGLVKLQYINLKGNKLQYLHPDTFLRLPNLLALHLEKNSDLLIPNDRHFFNSHSLKLLSISGCNVRSVSVQTFAKVGELEWLDLTYNYLRSVDINILKVLPNLSTLYLYANPLQCDCQLQEVWRRCQNHKIQTAYKEIVPICDTPNEVNGIWWGVLQKGQCLQDNIHYYGDYKNKSYSYKSIEDMGKDTKTDTETENKQREMVYSVVKQYGLPVSAVIFILGATGNVILIIIITCSKDMRTVPNMYILNLAISDMIYLTVLLLDGFRHTISVTWLSGEIGCSFFIFCYRMSVGLTAYSVAVLSIQRYRVTVNPLQVRVFSQATWRTTAAINSGVWIVAALFTIPAARSINPSCRMSVLLWLKNYYQLLSTFHLLVSCVLPLCVIAFSYIMTARHIMKSSCFLSEETQNPQLNKRKITANILLGLIVVFLISNVPIHILKSYLFYSINIHNPMAKVVESVDNLLDITSILNIFLSINSCLNPVALCCTSRAFRRQFKRYLTFCCKTKSPPTDFELTRRN
jgi:hypothetical protein